MATDKYSEKYGQLSGADLEILGAREQAATARALRTAYKPQQGQMVGGWYVKPSWTQNLADAMMQYNNYKNEQAGTAKAQELIDARKAATKANAMAQAGLSTQEPQPAYDREVTPASTMLINPEDQATTREPQKFFTGEPAPTPMGAQAVVAPTAEATGNINANPTNNRYTTHLPTDAQELTASDNVPAAILGNAVRNAPPVNVSPSGADLAADINSPTPRIAGGTPPQEQTLPTITTTATREDPQEAPTNNEATARILRGENPFDARPARVENIAAVTERMPAVKGYNEAEWLAQQQKYYLNDENKAGDAIGAYIKERQVAETSKANAATADRKMQREGELNRELRLDLATAQIADRKDRDAQRVIDDKAKAQSEHAFRMDIQKIADATTRRGQDMRSEDKKEANANKPITGVLAKELNDADEATFQSGLVQKQLQAALDLNDKAYSGFGALTRAEAAGKITGMVGGKANAEADATISLNNIITTQALESLKLTFGAAPTEGERKILLEIQGSVDKTPAQRKDIFERAMTMAKAKQGFHSRKAEAIRSGTWSKQNYNPSEPEVAATPTSAPMFASNGKTRIQSTDGGKTWQEVK
jgi:hypothetical protein